MKRLNFFVNFICLFIVLAIGLLACGENKTTTSSTTIAGDTTNENTTSGSTTISGDTTNENTSIVETTQNQTTTEVVLCDHTKLHHNSINFADYGMCSGLAYYDVCDCGEKMVVPGQLFYIGCDSELGYEVQKYTDENGVNWTQNILICDKCGAKIIYAATDVVEGCSVKNIADITIIKDDKVIWNNVYGEYVYNEHYEQSEEMNLTEYNLCESSLTIHKCRDCGEILDFGSLDCAIDFGSIEEIKPESFVDEDGFTHQVYKLQCPDCGLLLTYEIWNDPYSPCIEKCFASIVFSKGDIVILSLSDSTFNTNHKFENRYELLGEDCEAGYIETHECKKCGFIASWEDNGHQNSHFEIDLQGYGCCEGSIHSGKCDICGKIDSVYDDLSCLMSSTETNNKDEEGITHYVVTNICSTCELKKIEDSYVASINGCITTINATISYVKDDQVIISYSREYTEENHSYVYSYEMHGETCDSGYIAYQTCANCDYADSWEGNGHRDECFEIDLQGYSCCEGYINVWQCDICKKIYSVNRYSSCSMHYSNTNYTDEEGITHYVVTNICSACELKKIEDSYVASIDGCIITINETNSYMKGEQVIISYSREYTEENHDYVYSYEKHGETCDDGYTVYQTCANCDYAGSWEDSGHRDEQFEINLQENGCCEGFIYGWKCDICGKIDSVYDDLSCSMSTTETNYADEEGITHNVVTNICSTCELKKIEDSYVASIDGCIITINETISYMKGEQIIGSYNREYTEENHSYVYEYVGTCEDGYTVYQTCAKCDYSNSWEDNGHQDKYFEIELQGYGCCKGSIYGWKCDICGKIDSAHDGFSCFMSSTETNNKDEEGITHYVVTNICSTCELKKIEDSYVASINGCIITINETISYMKGEQIIGSYNREYTEENHSYVYEYVGTCEDGYTVYQTCANCDYADSWEDYGHQNKYFEIDLQGYSCCKGSIYVNQCDICEKIDSAYDDLSCFMLSTETNNKDEEGITHNVVTNICSTCELKKIEDSYVASINGCITTINKTISYMKGEQVIISYSREYTEENHDYVYSYEKHGETCDDGYTVTGVCSVCGDAYSYDDNGHSYTYVDEIDLNAYDGCCGGSIRVEKCVVCNNYYILEYCSCDFNETNTTAENGHSVKTLSCSTCQFKMVFEYWQETNEEGITLNKEILYFYYNEEKIKEIQN